jgi:hypothetical protein
MTKTPKTNADVDQEIKLYLPLLNDQQKRIVLALVKAFVSKQNNYRESLFREQREAVLKTLQDVQQHPEQLQPWDIAKYKRPEDIEGSGVEYTSKLKARWDCDYAAYKKGQTKMVSSAESKKRIGKTLKAPKVK